MAEDTAGPSDREEARRKFLQRAATVGMGAGLAGGYGTFMFMGARFLFPPGSAELTWQFVTRADELKVGESLSFSSPGGQTVVIARKSAGVDADEDFVALSSVCPHLGCQVHWEVQRDRFFCPCHNGAFDREGLPTEGPPATAGQTLTRFPLKIERDLLYIAVAEQRLDSGSVADNRDEDVRRGGATA